MSKKNPNLVTYECEGHIFVVPDRYQITGIVGKGAYGVVASAYDKVAKKKVAVKKIFNIFEHDKEYQKRILRELLVMNHFRGHENIICLTDLAPPTSYEKFKDVYIFMEFMDSDLRAVIRSKQPFTDVNVQYFLYQILRGMKCIHSANVLHRDIKPSNILLSDDYDVKLCDFGLSRGVDFSSDPKMSTTYVATRWYRAPELLLMWDKTSKAIDVWSIGCIFAELLDDPTPRRKVLFPGKHYLHQLDLILNVTGTPKDSEVRACTKARKYLKNLPKRKKKDLKKHFPKANPKALDLLDKMLAFDPLKRITVEEALAHPYLEQMHDEEEEPTAEEFDFIFSSEVESISIKKMMYDFITDWNKKVHGWAPGAKVDKRKIQVKYKK